MTITEATTHWARIYMAGPVPEAERICRDFCMEVGLCVSVMPASYIYTGGQEAGFVVGLINYPRFPATAEEIDAKAELLGTRLLVGLAQLSFSVETPQRTRWFSRRQEAPTDGVRPVQGLGYTWHPKECPCKSVQSEDCIENGCKWQRDPTLVPAELRVPAGVQPVHESKEN